GSQRAFSYMNIALRQKLWNDKGSVTLRVQDPFNMMTFGSTTANPQIVVSTLQNFGQRGMFITFSPHFGEELKLEPRPQDSDPAQAGPPSGGGARWGRGPRAPREECRLAGGQPERV